MWNLHRQMYLELDYLTLGTALLWALAVGHASSRSLFQPK